MYGLTIEIEDREVRAKLASISQAIADDQLKPVIGRAGVNFVKQHLLDYNSDHPNALGGKRTNFFATAGRETNFTSEGDGVSLNISQTGIAQRYFGGTIKPVSGKLLTIPANADAYGHRAGEFDNLELVGNRKYGFLALVERQSDAISIGRRRKDGSRGIKRGKKLGGRIMFWLVPSVTQKADPDVLPGERELGEHIRGEVGVYVEQQLSRQGGG